MTTYPISRYSYHRSFPMQPSSIIIYPELTKQSQFLPGKISDNRQGIIVPTMPIPTKIHPISFTIGFTGLPAHTQARIAIPTTSDAAHICNIPVSKIIINFIYLAPLVIFTKQSMSSVDCQIVMTVATTSIFLRVPCHLLIGIILKTNIITRSCYST